jgi:hypothetical protein
MAGYVNFFKNTADAQADDIVEALKKQDEFDNKIFIVTADHGHTAMPLPDQMTLPIPIKNEIGQVIDWKIWQGDALCELKLNNLNTDKSKYPELANNNLHIRELATMFNKVGTIFGLNYKVLAPEPIASLLKDEGTQELPYGATEDMNKANVVAALNGPMAHIYLRSGDNWRNLPSADELRDLAQIFKQIFQENGVNFDEDVRVEMEGAFPRLLTSIDKILIRVDNIYQIFNGLDGTGNMLPLDELTSLIASKYVKASARITGMNNLDRSGDIILVFKDFTNDIPENRYTSGVACKSWHGSLSPSDSYVPFIVAYPGGNKSEIIPLIGSTYGCGTVLGCDGNWRLVELIQSILNK